MRRRLVLLLAAALVLPAAMLLAEPNPPSNTGLSTAALFREAQDQYLSPFYFTELPGPVLFLQYDMPGLAANRFRLGAGLPLTDMLYAGAYLGASNYITPLLGSGNSTEQTKSTTYTLDPFGQIALTTVSTTKDAWWQNMLNDHVAALVGLRLGNLTLGIYNHTAVDQASAFGTYAPTFTMPVTATFTAPSVVHAADAASTVTTDNSGVVVAQSIDEYGPGESLSQGLTEELQAAISVPLGALKLMGRVGVVLTSSCAAASGYRERYQTTRGAGYPSYTPTTALPGATAAAIADLLTYTYTDGSSGSSSLVLNPSLYAAIDLPFALPFGRKYAAVFTPGLGVDLSFTTRSNGYTDLAGAAQTAQGNASSFYENYYGVWTIVNPAEIPTVRSVTRSYWTREYSQDIQHSYSPQLKLEVTPSETFRFGIQYVPELSFSSQAYTDSGGGVKAVTFEDGDGVDGNSTTTADDPDDFVVTGTVSLGQTSYSRRQMILTHYVSTAAQFHLIPKRLRVNLGGSLYNVMVDRTVTTRTTSGVTEFTDVTSHDGLPGVVSYYDLDPSPEPQQEIYDNNASGTFSIGYLGGFTFFFSDSMYLDLSFTGSGSTRSIWEIDNWSLELTILL